MSAMVDTRPVLMILGCQKYMKTLQLAIERSMRPAWHIVGVVGGVAETSFVDNILRLAVSDTYDDLPKKVYEAYKWICAAYPHAVGIFKTDDDIYYHDIVEFEGLVVKHQSIPYWGFHVERASAGPISVGRIEGRFDNKTPGKQRPAAIYCWGCGYWLARAAVEHMVTNCKGAFYEQHLEDACVGACLNRVGIIPTQICHAYAEVNRAAFLEGRIVKEVMV
jgi:hypothetical protein